MNRKRNDPTDAKQIFENSVKTSNTIGGPYQENRGRRSASKKVEEWEKSPFEDGQLDIWNHRKGWDRYYQEKKYSDSKKHGGNLIQDTSIANSGSLGYQRSDAVIYEEVSEILKMTSRLNLENLNIDVKQGVVYLFGSVSNRFEKKEIESILERISGVRDIQNYLSIKKNQLH